MGAAGLAPVGDGPVAGEVLYDPDLEPVDVDFDAAFAERRAAKKPKRIRLSGKVFELPAALPASFVLFAVRAQKGGRSNVDQVSGPEALRLLESLLGPEVEEILAEADMDELPDLLKACMAMYDEADDGEGEQSRPPVTRRGGATRRR